MRWARVIKRTGAELTVEVLGPGNNEDTLKDFAIMSTPDMRLDIYLFESSRFRDMWLPQIQAQGEVVCGPSHVCGKKLCVWRTFYPQSASRRIPKYLSVSLHTSLVIQENRGILG